LAEFTSIREEISADRIFENARKKITRWYTAGGLVVFLLSAFGLKIFLDYTEDLAKSKMEAVTDAKIQQILNKKTEEKLNPLIDRLKDSANLLVKQKINEISISASSNSAQPISAKTSINQESPDKVDYAVALNPISNQGEESSGPAFAICTAFEYEIFKKTGTKIVLSPRYLYNGVNDGSDYGVYLDKAFAFLIDKGDIENKYWPYVSGEYKAQPPASALAARHYKLKGYSAVSFIDYTGIRNSLSNNKIVIGNIVVYQELLAYTSGVISPPPLKAVPMAN
jgi:Papain family cysteine protease